MKTSRMPEMHDANVNVTPLIDIVMCLIIFFMLVTKIGVATGADNAISLPPTVQGVNIDDFGNSVTLNVYRGAGDEPRVTTLDPATSQIIDLPIVQPSASGPKTPLMDFLKLLRAKNDKLKVVIRANDTMEYKFLQPVLKACAFAKVTDVNFATKIGKKLEAQ
jgi:biopolymer transport protein ExbD